MKTEAWSEKLDAARERAHRYSVLQRREEGLRERLNSLAGTVNRLAVELDMEQEDVDRLNRLSWSSLFHTVTFSKDEQLQMEQQQVLAAELKLQQAKAEEERAKAELASVRAEAADLHDADRAYRQLLLDREKWIAASGTQEASRLGELTDRIAALQDTVREHREAVTAGNRLEHALDDAERSLEKAENWGTYDMLGGGLISTAMKHGNIDDAKAHLENAGHLMHVFRKELDDVQTTADLSIEIGSFASFADYFFDGLIADWFVQKRISGSLSRIQEQRRKVGDLLIKLKQRLLDAERELAAQEAAKKSLIEGMPG